MIKSSSQSYFIEKWERSRMNFGFVIRKHGVNLKLNAFETLICDNGKLLIPLGDLELEIEKFPFVY